MNLKFSSFLILWHFLSQKLSGTSGPWSDEAWCFALLLCLNRLPVSIVDTGNYMPSNWHSDDNTCLLKFSLSVLYMSCFSCCSFFKKNCSVQYLHGCFFQMAVAFCLFCVAVCTCRKWAEGAVSQNIMYMNSPASSICQL